MFKILCLHILKPPRSYSYSKTEEEIRDLSFGPTLLQRLIDKYRYESIMKILKPDCAYWFYDDYCFADGKKETVKKKPEEMVGVSDNFYGNGTPHISISAIVGENGQGKSSLIELIIRLINNAAYGMKRCLKVNEDYPQIFVNGIFARLHLLVTDEDGADRYLTLEQKDDVMGLYENNGAIIWKFRYTKLSGTEFPRFENECTEKRNTELPDEINWLSDLFYTVVVNYSSYAYNVNDYQNEGKWIDALFHKNDGYQLPIVLNPYRHKGSIDFNNERILTRERLFLLLLNSKNPMETILQNKKVEAFYFAENKEHLPEYGHRYSSPKLLEVMAWAGVIKDKEHPDYQKVYKFAKVLIDGWSHCFGVDFDAVPNKLLHEDVAIACSLNYLAYKTIKIMMMYERYKHYKNSVLRHQAIDKYIKELYFDKSHVTMKIRRTIALLLFRHYHAISSNSEHAFRTSSIKQRQFIDSIGHLVTNQTSIIADERSNRTKKSYQGMEYINPEFTEVDLLPAPSVKCDIILTDKDKGEGNILFSTLSSGEKQMIYTMSTMLYHLMNIDSVWDGNNKDAAMYKRVNIIFDELELYFHPKYQAMLVKFLIDQLRGMKFTHIKDINILLSTHSPFILSDIPNQNILYIKNGEPVKDKNAIGNTFCANIYDMLANPFFMSSFVGAFAASKLSEIAERLKGLRQKQDEGEIIKKEEVSSLEKDIKLIGDDFIRKNFQEQLNPFYDVKEIKRREIAELQKRIKKLQKEI